MSASVATAHPDQSLGKGHPATCDGRAVTDHVARFHKLILKGYALERWEAGPKRSAIHKAQRHRRCIHVLNTRRQLAEFRDKHRRLFDQYAASQRSITPFDCGSAGSFAVPCAIVNCESHYIATARNSASSAGGYYQILDGTWFAYGGSHNGDSHPAAAAPPDEQHQVASRLYQAEGTHPWDASSSCWGG